MEGKSNKVIIGVFVSIIVIFVTLFVLILTGVIKFNNKSESKNEKVDETTTTVVKENNKVENKIDSSKYVGTWFENEETAKDNNSNSLEIVSISDDNIKFGFYISRTAQFENIEVFLSSTLSSAFEAEALMGPTKDGSKGKVSGVIKVSNDNIMLTIEDTNIIDLKNQTLIFQYRKDS